MTDKTLEETKEVVVELAGDMLELWAGKPTGSVIYAIGVALARSIEHGAVEPTVADEIKLVVQAELGQLTGDDFSNAVEALKSQA